MKSTIHALLLTGALAATTLINPCLRAESAPTGGEGGARGTGPMMRMATELGLTPDQITKLKSIHEARKAEMKALREKYDAQIKGVLTPEQYAKFDAKRKERMEKMKSRRQKHAQE